MPYLGIVYLCMMLCYASLLIRADDIISCRFQLANFIESRLRLDINDLQRKVRRVAEINRTYSCPIFKFVQDRQWLMCSQSECPRPLAFYKAIGCKPMENDDNCAKQYDCDNVKWLSSHISSYGTSYDVGESLKDEDNVQEVSSYVIKNNCAPVYDATQSPQTDTADTYRCQNDRDEVIKSKESMDKEESVCHFGSLVLQLGEKLNQPTDYNSVCVKCVCEVPPTVTCQRLPDKDCDVNAHTNENFMNRLQDSISTMINKLSEKMTSR